MDDLVEREGLHYKKFSVVPFTGKTTGNVQGTFRNGKKHGPWVSYWDNGQLQEKGTYKNGKLDGPRVTYNFYGTVEEGPFYLDWEEYTKTFKDGVRISE